MTRRLRILTWHVHGAYLWYLSHIPHDLIVPVKPGRPEGYGGRGGSLRWPDNLYEVPAGQVADLELDAVLFQSHRNWLVDQHEILSPAQRRLPRLHLEHDPPRASPTDTVHPVDDPEVLVVHVTPFNRLMWDCGPCPTAVVEHGVTVPAGVRWNGNRARGVVVCEAMLLGVPVVALATTEMSTVIRSGHNGYAETDEASLVASMRHLIDRPDVAVRLGANAQRTARARFGLGRFVADWDAVLTGHVGRVQPGGAAEAASAAEAGERHATAVMAGAEK